MTEHKTPEQELRELIAEGKTILVKLKKTLNGIIYVGVPVLIAFIGSTYYSNSRIATIEATRMTNEKIEEKFATKQQIVFLQNDITDLNNFVFSRNPLVQTEIFEKRYTQALKEFMGDVSRGAETDKN